MFTIGSKFSSLQCVVSLIVVVPTSHGASGVAARDRIEFPRGGRLESRALADKTCPKRPTRPAASACTRIRGKPLLLRIWNDSHTAPFSSASPAEYGAGLKLAIERGWLWMHESGTYVKFTPASAELFA
jgi:hypothetical protein